jgi:hypothetical protein
MDRVPLAVTGVVAAAANSGRSNAGPAGCAGSHATAMTPASATTEAEMCRFIVAPHGETCRRATISLNGQRSGIAWTRWEPTGESRAVKVYDAGYEESCICLSA